MMDAIDLIIRANTLVDSKHASGASKEKLYKWLVHDKPGTFMLINKNDLYVDQSYQRDKINNSRVNLIISKFSWAAFGAVSISMRDGKWRVVDGQHRCLAAMKMDSITEIPCMVFESTTQEEEARTFLSVNSNRSAVNAYTKFKAGLVAKDSVCLSIQSAVDKLGYAINENACKAFDIGCTWALMQAERAHAGSVFDTLSVLKPLASQGVLPSSLIRALQIVRVNIPDGLGNKTFRSRISNMSLAVIEKLMKDEALMAGKGAPSIWAKGLINAVNANHRQKIRMVKHEDGE